MGHPKIARSGTIKSRQTGPATKRRRKKRKSLTRRVFSEVVDLIEDIFD